MANFYKYLPLSQQDEDWGLHVLNTGHNRVVPKQEYPSPAHPGHHYFRWSKGRILQEFQVVYITKGSGYFESAHCALKKIQAGTVFILFPGEWHRFKPDSSTGWDEYWVGFEGSIVKNSLVKSSSSCQLQFFISAYMKVYWIFLQTLLRLQKRKKRGINLIFPGPYFTFLARCI